MIQKIKLFIIVFCALGLILQGSFAFANIPKYNSKKSSKEIDLSQETELTEAEKKAMTKYMTKLQKKLLDNWNPARNDSSLSSKVYFKVQLDGKISDLKMQKRSGSYYFDKLSLETVIMSAPFDPLPVKEAAEIEFTFDYNFTKPKDFLGFSREKVPAPAYLNHQATTYSLEEIENRVPKTSSKDSKKSEETINNQNHSHDNEL